MGKLLKKAIAEASRLPEKEQEEVGAWLLAELESERRWDELFATAGERIEEMAEQALREDAAGKTAPLDAERL